MLDRYTGKTWVLVRGTDDVMKWQTMRVESDLPSIPNPAAPRFQIFSSGLALRFTFLLDTVKGDCWVLTDSEKEGMFWAYVAEVK